MPQIAGRRCGPSTVVSSPPNEPNDDQEKFDVQLARMNPALRIGVPIRISQSRADLRVPAETIRIPNLPAVITIRGVNVLVEELEDTNKDSTSSLEYKRYPIVGPDMVIPPNPDPGGLGVHFATINHDLTNLTNWLTERFADPD